MRIAFFLTLSLLAAGLRPAAAQEARLIGTVEHGESIQSVLRRAGCNTDWLSKAVSDSSIAKEKILKPDNGQRIILRVGSCQDRPPTAVKSATALILRKPVPPQVAQVKKEEPAQEQAVKPLATKPESEVAKGKDSTPPPLPPLDEVKSVEAVSALAWLRFVVAVLAGGLVGFAVLFLIIRKRTTLPKVKVVRFEGEKFSFPTIGSSTLPSNRHVSLHSCPLCQAEGLPDDDKSLVNHLRRECPNMRRYIVRGSPAIQRAFELKTRKPA